MERKFAHQSLHTDRPLVSSVGEPVQGGAIHSHQGELGGNEEPVGGDEGNDGDNAQRSTDGNLRDDTGDCTLVPRGCHQQQRATTLRL